MSVFGGDSWGREAQYRKRRVDDLLLDAGGDHSSYRKLPSGKYACLVCPHNPVLDTPLVLSIHMKARRHLAAELQVKQREEARRNEMNKRIALSTDSSSIRKTDGIVIKQINIACSPLIEKTRKGTIEVLQCGHPELSTSNTNQSRYPDSARYGLTSSTFVQTKVSGKDVVQIPIDYRERRERELKFTAAGWKRDCRGGWFRDENVEYDSDEEDPNEYFANKE